MFLNNLNLPPSSKTNSNKKFDYVSYWLRHVYRAISNNFTALNSEKQLKSYFFANCRFYFVDTTNGEFTANTKAFY